MITVASRISVEMVQKAAVLGVPFLAAVSAPSALALRLASDAGMGLAAHIAAGGKDLRPLALAAIPRAREPA